MPDDARSTEFDLQAIEFPPLESSDSGLALLQLPSPDPTVVDLAEQHKCLTELMASTPPAAAVLEEVVETVRRDAAALVRNFPVTSDAALVGLLCAIGDVALQRDHDDPAGARLIWNVRPNEMAETASFAHGSKSRRASPLHTDAVQILPRHRYLALACLMNSPDNGAATLLLRLEDLLSDLSDSDRSLLAEPAYTFAQQVHGQPETTTTSVLPMDDTVGAGYTIRYSRKALDDGRSAGPALDRAHADALDKLRDLLDDHDRTMEVSLAPGDVLVIDNTRALHGRAEIRGPQRHLKRLRALSRTDLE